MFKYQERAGDTSPPPPSFQNPLAVKLLDSLSGILLTFLWLSLSVPFAPPPLWEGGLVTVR
jgi:hypothetical protein